MRAGRFGLGWFGWWVGVFGFLRFAAGFLVLVCYGVGGTDILVGRVWLVLFGLLFSNLKNGCAVVRCFGI